MTDVLNVITMANKLPYTITLIHPSAGVNRSGGAEVMAIQLAKRLADYFDVKLLCGADCGPFSHPINCIQRTQEDSFINHPLVASLTKKKMSHPEILVEHITSFIPCLNYLIKNPADLVFPHNGYGGLAVAATARALTNTPILFTEHAGFLGEGKVLRRDLNFKPDHLVVFEESLARKARGISAKQPISVIPNGIDLDRFSSEGASIDIDLNKPLIVCVASLNRTNHKRVELAIRAVSRLPEASLLICGAGPDHEYFQTLGNQLLGEKRFAIRTFPFEQMPQVYRCADIFTLPSINEPFACGYLEAMASGLPIVTTDDEVRRYMVQDGGILCDVTDIDAYADALKMALEKNWGDLPRKSALRFDWKNVIPQYRDLIVKVIQNSKRNKQVKPKAILEN